MESPQAIPQGEGSRERTESTTSNYFAFLGWPGNDRRACVVRVRKAHRRSPWTRIRKKTQLRSELFSAPVTFSPLIYVNSMSEQELESAVAQLSPEELTRFTAWFEEFVAEA